MLFRSISALSSKSKLLYTYFKQNFAQVTNPPIDPIRERLVMSLATFAGNNGNLLVEDPLALAYREGIVLIYVRICDAPAGCVHVRQPP